MPLDFHAKSDSGVDHARKIDLTVDEHWKLVEVSRNLNLRLFRRFHDYYGEAEVSQREMIEFVEELARLSNATGVPQALRNIVNDLISLATHAAAQNKSIIALPD
jgi:hypothetical protein